MVIIAIVNMRCYLISEDGHQAHFFCVNQIIIGTLTLLAAVLRQTKRSSKNQFRSLIYDSLF